MAIPAPQLYIPAMNDWLATSAEQKRTQIEQWIPQGLSPQVWADYWAGARSHIVAATGLDPGGDPPSEWGIIFTMSPEQMGTLRVAPDGNVVSLPAEAPQALPEQVAPGGDNTALVLVGVAAAAVLFWALARRR